jgi:7,8-dihydroneopterin aldolase/epimerase/oxygenase
MVACNGQLELCGLEVRCIIGDLPEERLHEQVLVLDVTLVLDLSQVLVSDALQDTVDYVTVAKAIRETLKAKQFRMIETAAACAAEVCLRQPRVAAVKVRVEKAGAVAGLRAAAVTVERQREGVR